MPRRDPSCVRPKKISSENPPPLQLPNYSDTTGVCNIKFLQGPHSSTAAKMVYTLTVHLYANDNADSIPRIKAKLIEAARIYRKDKETVDWIVMQDVHDPRAFTIVERFENESSQKYHLENPYWKTFDPYVIPLLDRTMDLRRHEELDTSKDVEVPVSEFYCESFVYTNTKYRIRDTCNFKAGNRVRVCRNSKDKGHNSYALLHRVTRVVDTDKIIGSHNRILIDLTGDDDDDDQPVPGSSSLEEDFPISNHGFILPGTFNFSERTGPKLRNGDATPQIGYTSRPAGDSLRKRALNETSPYIANSAKRRKTNGASILPVLSAVSMTPIPGQIHREQASRASGSPPSTNAVPGGVEQPWSVEGKPQVLLDGQLRKVDSHPKVPHANNEYKAYKGYREHLANVLRSQIFPHVKTAMLRHCGTLSQSELTEIGTKAVDKIVKDESFDENYAQNNWSLSAKYEKAISKKARGYVDKFAAAKLVSVGLRSTISAGIGRAINSQGQSKATNSANNEYALRKGISSRITQPKNESQNSSNSFEEGHKTFGTSVTSTTHITRTRSSVPTPSFVASKGSEINRKRKVTPRNSLRLLRRSISTNAAQSSESLSIQSAPISTTKLPQGSIDVSLESQSLQLARLHLDNPRPYVKAGDIEYMRRGIAASGFFRPDDALLEAKIVDSVMHVGFSLEEMRTICAYLCSKLSRMDSGHFDLKGRIASLMAGQMSQLPHIIDELQEELKLSDDGRRLLQTRSISSIFAFLQDAIDNRINTQLQAIHVKSEPRDLRMSPRISISSLLLEREVFGLSHARIRRGQKSLRIETLNQAEDSLTLQSEWTDCCGDISALSWTSNTTFVCGATAHSDSHNMQYNKPGNLLVGSSSLDTLTAVADHRIPRPIVGTGENAENAMMAMRRTQDPWLYTSVVATAHRKASGITFTASFDETVKVWKVNDEGPSMQLLGTWQHDGKVNFVVTSEYHEFVATASDVTDKAVRVYRFEDDDVCRSSYDTYTADKALEQTQELRRRETWAYFPATIQWGKAESVAHLLLVGYSPRSITTHEVDIPDDKKNSGELCVWDVRDGSRLPISSARTQNVFEVIWHPSQPCFLAATSPCGVIQPETRTQIRLFAQNEVGAFIQLHVLDCPALDINELTINIMQCYVTASCTDGNTYVWDTAQPDHFIHALSHEVHDVPREIADTGVKFAAWGNTSTRLYTGSSDGKVKAWDVRAARGKAFVREVLAISGGISVGSFSDDFSKLILGDSAGKVYLLGHDDKDLRDNEIAPLGKIGFGSGQESRVDNHSHMHLRRPKVIKYHPEPPPPDDGDMDEIDWARALIDKKQLKRDRDRRIGVVKGENYHETLMYRLEAHEEHDGTKDLLPEWEALQQCQLFEPTAKYKQPRLRRVDQSADDTLHSRNLELDFDVGRLLPSTRKALERDRVELNFDDEHLFEYEMMPKFKVFRS
ncbi:hypothetical protein B7494_g6773 [Chlorociboria aeruginascens]|nr:hypothetical protein B7494_g6773 [Chlorociboria aeruginascens]